MGYASTWNPLVGVSPQSHSEGFCVGVQASAGVKSQAGIYSQKACKHKSIETLIIRAKKKKTSNLDVLQQVSA